MGKHTNTINKEVRIAAIFFLVLLAVNLLPDIFALNSPSGFYEKYYTGVLPFSITQVLLVIFFIRWAYLFINYLMNERKKNREK